MENEKIEKILEIKVDVEAAIKSMAELTEELEKSKAAEKNLRDQLDKLKENEKENADAIRAKKEEIIKVKEEQKSYAAQIREISTTVQNEMKVEREANQNREGSIKQLRAELSNLTKQYDGLSKAEREGAKGSDLKKHINELTDEIKTAEEGTQRYQRNVGNYKSALQGASTAFKGAGINANVFNGQLKALSANPIIAILTVLVTILAAVIKAFKGNEEATMAFKEAIAPLNPIIDAVKRAFESLANILVKVVKVAVQGLMDALGWLLKKLQAIGNWFGADWHFADNFEAGRAAASAAAVALAEAENKLIKDKRAWVTESAKLDREIADLREKAANKEKYTAQERLEFLDKVIALETQKAAKEKQLAEENLRVLQLEAQRTANSAEMNDKLAEAEAAVIAADTKLSETKRNLSKQRQAALTALEKEKEATINATKEAQEALISLMKEGVEKETALENARFEKAKATLQAKIDEEKKKNGEETELYKAYAAQMEAIEAEHQDKLDKISLAGRQKEIEQTMQTMQMKLDLIKNNLDEEFDIKRQMLDQTLELELSKTEYTEEQKALIRQKYAQDVIELEQQKRLALEEQTNLEWSNRIEAAKLMYGEYLDSTLESMQLEMDQAREHLDNLQRYELESDAEYHARLIAAQKDYLAKKKQFADAEIQIEKAKATATMNMAGSLSDLLDTVASENKEAVALSKTLALAEVAIKQGVAISEAVASAAAGDPYTYALRVAAAITSTITAMAQALMSINSAKFSRGTSYVTYPGKTERDGDVVPALLTPGEGVVTTKANQMFPGVVQAMNDLAAGISVPATSFMPFVSMGGATQGMTAAEMREIMTKMPAPIVSVEEINNIEQNVKAVENVRKVA